MKHYIVWNNDRSEGFVTTDKQLAYEVRKSSDTNCCDENGRRSEVGVAFCDAWGDHDCTTQEIDIPLPTEKGIEFAPTARRTQVVSEDGKVAAGRDLQAVVKSAAEKLDAAKRCHPNAVETLIDEALEILDGDRNPADHSQNVKNLSDTIRRCVSFLETAPVSSGVCCCGAPIEGHADHALFGHSPKDKWDYAVESMVAELIAVLAVEPQTLATGDGA